MTGLLASDYTPANVWAVVVHYRDTTSTRATVDALAASTVPVEIVVSDNAGNWPDTGDARALPFIGNLGYAGGANRGIVAALAEGATHVWLMNNDVRPGADALGLLLATAAAAPAASIVGCRQGDVSEGGRDVVARAPILPASRRGRVRTVGCDDDYPGDFVNAFCMLVSRSTIETVGLLEESFFHYFEDVEYSMRAMAHGVDVIRDCRVLVEHRRGSSLSEASPDAAYYYLRNRLLLGARLSGKAELSILLGCDRRNGLRPLISQRRLRGRDWAWLRAAWQGTFDGVRGVSGRRRARHDSMGQR